MLDNHSIRQFKIPSIDQAYRFQAGSNLASSIWERPTRTLYEDEPQGLQKNLWEIDNV